MISRTKSARKLQGLPFLGDIHASEVCCGPDGSDYKQVYWKFCKGIKASFQMWYWCTVREGQQYVGRDIAI